MKRMSSLLREENYEHVLMCLICRSLFDDCDHQPKFLPCHHTFCKDCLREYVRQMGDDIECPSCRKVTTIPAAGVTALQTNFYVKYIQGLVHGAYVGNGGNTKCTTHTTEDVQHYCKDCRECVCGKCCSEKDAKCATHSRVSITTITEECHHKLDTSFTRANSLIENKRTETEAFMKALSTEKDEALKKIDSTIEQHAHTLHRRGTLLKNKVIDIYNEHVSQLETDLEEISTAMTCIVSLKEYHEELIGRAMCQGIDRGIEDIDDVFENISQKITPSENHIVFEDKHGVEKFHMAAKDLGRVRNSRPTGPRSEPEGGRDLPIGRTSTPLSPPVSDPDFSPLPGNRLDLVGAEAGACGPAESDIQETNDTTLLPNQTCDSKQLDQNGSHSHNQCAKLVSREDSNANKTTDNGFGSALSISNGQSLDSNSNQQYVAARPKSFDMTKRKAKSTSSTKGSKSHMYGNSVHSIEDKRNYNFGDITRDLRGKQTAVPTLKLINTTSDEPLSIPDLEALKQTDKMYHHLVYTSYDEEELLKELKSGKVALADSNISFIAKMSDSWMTESTPEVSDLSTSDDPNMQQSTL